MKRIGIVILAGAMSLIGVGASQENYAVDIQTDRVPRMSPQEVARVVKSNLARPVESLVPGDSGPQIEPGLPEITSMRLVTRDNVNKVTDENGQLDRRLVWVVHAKGRFVNFRVPRGSRPTVRNQGFYIISDETGNVLGFGSSTPESPHSDAIEP